MNKKTGYLLGILLTIIIGMLLMWFFCCSSGASSGVTNQGDQSNQVAELSQMGFAIKDPNGDFSFSDKANLDFNNSKSLILQPISGAVDNGIGKLRTYLNQDRNTSKSLDITGYYDTDEENNSAFQNLGLARANTTKNYFVSKGIPASRINTYGELKDALVPDGNIYRGPVSFGIGKQSDDINQVNAPTQMGFAIKDPNGNFSFSDKANLDFNISKFSILQPVSGVVDNGIAKVRTYLNEDSNTGKSIDITGYYYTDEENNSAFPNLGLARANTTKNYFVSKGIPPSRINTYGELNEALVPDGNIYRGPVSFGIRTPSNDNDQSQTLADLKARINANPLILHFNTAKASISLSIEQRQKVSDINRYLDKVPGSTISITGHTDNIGDPAGHMPLGLNRANFAKEYFVKNGLSEAKINTASKGDKKPVADNRTLEGRAKNRRSVVTLN